MSKLELHEYSVAILKILRELPKTELRTSNTFLVYSDNCPTSQMFFAGKTGYENEMPLHTNYDGHSQKDNNKCW